MILPELDGVAPADIQLRHPARLRLTDPDSSQPAYIGGPAFPKSILAQLIASMQGTLTDAQHQQADAYETDRYKNQRLADTRLKSRRARALKLMFSR